MKDYFSLRFFIYFLRWQFTTLLMMPFMIGIRYWFPHLPDSIVLIIIQSIGAILMYKIDKFILTH